MTEPGLAAEFNRTGSPTGRISNEAADTSVLAAVTTNAYSHREIIYAFLVAATEIGRGATSIEAAGVMPLTRHGNPQVSNRSASRLGELWEEGRAAIWRERGHCILGDCHTHNKPSRIHRPTAKCNLHGRPLTRDGASIWIAIGVRSNSGTTGTAK